MRINIARSLVTPHRIVFAALAAAGTAPALASPYYNPGPFVAPVPPVAGMPAFTGMPSPAQVSGKEYSDRADHNTLAAGLNLDAGQLVAWDGLGGTADGRDYYPIDGGPPPDIDAIAVRYDSLFQETLDDKSHLIYSVSSSAHTTKTFGVQPVIVPFVGPVVRLTGRSGEIVGGSGELNYELGRFGGLYPENKHAVWATRPQIDDSLPAQDLDAIELWGAEPSAEPSEADKYSVYNDATTAELSPPYAVLNSPSTSGYVPLSMVADLVFDLLEFDAEIDPEEIDIEDIDLDALMVLDSTGSPNAFQSGDRILFSVRQIPFANASDGSGFLATGSEIFWLDGGSTAQNPIGGFLTHGGHEWNKQYALNYMTAQFHDGDNFYGVQLDLDALEAVAGLPEPASFWLMACAFAIHFQFFSRRGSR